MRVSWIGFLGQNHSWSFVAQNICKVLIERNHEVDLFSTNGLRHLPTEFMPYLKGFDDSDRVPIQNIINKINSTMNSNYDLSLSYTAPKNFPFYLSGKSKFAIWAMEFFGKNTFPKGFSAKHIACDKILAPSKFCHDVFIDQGIPEDKVEIIPHGYNQSFISRTNIHKINTNRSFKFLCNYGQLHKRKNIEGVLEAFCRAFDHTEDVALIVKVNKKQPKAPFEVSWDDIYNRINRKYPKHAPIISINEFIEDISDIYRACNAVVSLSHGEGFNLPILEGIAANKITISPDKGGHIDFAKNCSLLVKSDEVRCPSDYQYWEPSPYAKMYSPDINDAADKMRMAFLNENYVLSTFQKNIDDIKQKYTWENVVKRIEELC